MPIKDKHQGLAARQAAAQQMAVSALSFIAADEERLVRFLGETGLSPANLREAAAKRHFGAGVLAFVLSDEPTLIAFAAEMGLDPAHVVKAYDILSPPVDPDAPVRRPM